MNLKKTIEAPIRQAIQKHLGFLVPTHQVIPLNSQKAWAPLGVLGILAVQKPFFA